MTISLVPDFPAFLLGCGIEASLVGSETNICPASFTLTVYQIKPASIPYRCNTNPHQIRLFTKKKAGEQLIQRSRLVLMPVRSRNRHRAALRPRDKGRRRSPDIQFDRPVPSTISMRPMKKGVCVPMNDSRPMERWPNANQLRHTVLTDIAARKGDRRSTAGSDER